MNVNPDDLDVLHNIEETRFEIHLDGLLAVLEYQRDGDTMIFTHTYVPPEFEGQGIASRLAYTALEHAKEKKYKIVSLCSFIDVYLRRHREYQEPE